MRILAQLHLSLKHKLETIIFRRRLRPPPGSGRRLPFAALWAAALPRSPRCLVHTACPPCAAVPRRWPCADSLVSTTPSAPRRRPSMLLLWLCRPWGLPPPPLVPLAPVACVPARLPAGDSRLPCREIPKCPRTHNPHRQAKAKTGATPAGSRKLPTTHTAKQRSGEALRQAA
jgi:hypothetical protein